MKTNCAIVSYLLAIMVCAGTTQADMKTYGPFTISKATTNWSSTISVPKFNPSLGTLQSIKFELTGHVEGLAKFESKEATPATITTKLTAEIELQWPDSSLLLVTIPLASTSDYVTAFDGTIDFGGTSGRTHDALSNDKTETLTSPPPDSDLILFTGSGNIVLPIKATGKSSCTGGGNLLVLFNTYASASATVTYTYDVPEPAALSLLLLGLGSLTMMKRKRKH